MGKNRSGEFTREGGEIPCVELSGVELSVQGISGREKIMGESDRNLTELSYLNHHIR